MYEPPYFEHRERYLSLKSCWSLRFIKEKAGQRKCSAFCPSALRIFVFCHWSKMLGKGNCVIKANKQTTNQLRRNAQIKQTNKQTQAN